MTFSAETVLLGLLSALVGVMAFFGRELWSSYKELQRIVFELKEEIPSRYLHRDDFKVFRVEILEAIGRLEGYLRESIRK